MVTIEQAVESRSAVPNRDRRRTPGERRTTPEEIEGFESVVLSPGGQVDVLNISNSGMFVETETRGTPGSVVRVRISTTGGRHEVQAKIVRSEVTTGDGGGLRYRLAISFDETLDLIDEGDVADVDAAEPSAPETPTDLLPPDENSTLLQLSRSANRW